MGKFKYETFEDWFNELEGNYQMRSERYINNVQNMNQPDFVKCNIAWLRQAFENGRLLEEKT
jgi:hypothetical protein